MLSAADTDRLLQAAPAERRVLEETIIERDGDAFALLLAPRATLIVVPCMQCDVHRINLSYGRIAQTESADRFRGCSQSERAPREKSVRHAKKTVDTATVIPPSSATGPPCGRHRLASSGVLPQWGSWRAVRAARHHPTDHFPSASSTNSHAFCNSNAAMGRSSRLRLCVVFHSSSCR